MLPAGTIAGHAASYLLSGRRPHGGVHGYLDFACWPVALAALGALAWFAGSRQGARWTPRSLPFAAAQVGLFLFQEVVEGLVDGRGPGASLAAPTVRYGVVVQLVLAVGMVLLTRVAVAGGARLRAATLGRPAWRPKHPAVLPPAAECRRVGMVVASPVSERGPPTLLVSA